MSGSATSHHRFQPQAERLAEIFTVLQRCFLLNLSKELGRGQLSFPQYLLLGFLQQSEHLSMREISDKMRHTMAASTGLVDRLERLGLVARQHATDDRRKILVHITPKGRAVVTRIREDMVASLLRLMEHLQPEEVESWVRIYEKIFPLCLRNQNCPDR